MSQNGSWRSGASRWIPTSAVLRDQVDGSAWEQDAPVIVAKSPLRSEPLNERNRAVAVEKLHFSRNSENLRDGKCLGKQRKSFVGLPSAKFFRPVLRDRVFQQPRADFNNQPFPPIALRVARNRVWRLL
jgi:hypothetical protein